MELKYVATYHGPNPYAGEPALLAKLSVTAGDADLEAGLTRLQGLYPQWLPNAELGETPTLAQRAAHTAARWALAALNEVRGYLHHAGVALNPHGVPVPTGNEAYLFLSFHHEATSRQALELGLKALSLAGQDAAFGQAALQPALENLWLMCRKHHPDYPARILMQGAQAMDVPYLPAWGIARHWQFGWGKRSRVMFETSSMEDGNLGARVAGSKAAAINAMRTLGAPTPRHVLVNNSTELAAAAKQIGWPCVTKPLNRGGGRGVSAGLRSMEELQAGFAHAREGSSGPVMVEQFVQGDDHRLMVVDGRLIAAIRREAAQVLGDGRRSVRELVGELNAGRSARNPAASSYFSPVALDAAALQHLAAQGATPETVPPPGKNLSLRSNANLATGGMATNVTDRLHPQLRQMAESMALSFRLYSVGFDYLTTDISQSCETSGGAFIEFNCTPGMTALILAGWSPEESARVVLGTVPGRVPLTLLVVPDAELPEVQSALAGRAWPQGHGWVCGGAAQLGAMPLRVNPSRGWADVRALLQHQSLEQAMLVCGALQLQSQGLPVDKVDEAVLCGADLPETWLAVLAGCSARVEKNKLGWKAYIRPAGTAQGERRGGENA